MTAGIIDASPEELHTSPRGDDRSVRPGASSPTGSVATASSPAQTLAHFSSPDLPPLPSLPRIAGFPPSTPSPSAPAPKTDTTYYTASWGSPYPVPPQGASSELQRGRTLDWSDDFEDDSPDPKFGLGHLIPSRLPFLQQDVTPTRPTTPASDKSPAHSQRRAERGSWFSPTRSRAHKQSHSTGEPSRLQLEGGFGKPSSWWNNASKSVKPLFNRHQSQDAREIKLGEFDGESGFIATESDSAEEFRKSHRPRGSNSTLTQADFWPAIKSFRDSISGMYNSRWAVDPLKAEKESKASASSKEAPVAEATTSTRSPEVELPTPAFDIPSPPLARKDSYTHSSSARPKKKIPFKKKFVIIGLPVDPPRGGEGELPFPLSPSAVAARLKSFEEQGYDTRGFENWESGNGNFGNEDHATNRAIFPDETEQSQVFNQRALSVRLPDTKEWDAHVKKILDDKLRALGVSPAGEEPASAALSRQASSQFSSAQPFSPPVRTSSVGGQLPSAYPLGAFPPGFIPGSSTHTSRGSVASPISSIDPRLQSLHMHRQSMFSPPNMQAQLQQQVMGPPGIRSWSPQQIISPPGLVQSGSPVLSTSRPDPSRGSPVTPFQVQLPHQQFPFAQREELLVQMQRQQQQQQQLLQLQQLQQQQQIVAAQATQQPRPASTLQKVLEAEEDVDEPLHRSPNRGPEIANPKPSHRHNISVKLEQDIHNAHFDLENSIGTGQGQKASEQLLKSPSWSNGDDVTAIRAATQNKPHANGTKREDDEKSVTNGASRSLAVELGETKDGSDILTNPSDIEPDTRLSAAVSRASQGSHVVETETSWTNDPTFDQKPASGQSAQRRSHSSKASLSGLNVEAMEFNPGANPYAAFNPATFSGSSFAFQPSATAKPFVPRSTQHAPQASVTKAPSFNANAPAFNPQFGGFGGAKSNKAGEFSFTPQVATFKPTAAVFSPGSSLLSDRSIGTTDTDNSNRIFTNIDLATADSVSHVKRSKALPIVVPRNRFQSDPRPAEEDMEDEDGRITQSDARQKRARHIGADGDAVPQFAMPSSPPSFVSQLSRELSEEPSFPQLVSEAQRLEETPIDAAVSPEDVIAIEQAQSQDEIVVEEELSDGEGPEEIDVVEVEVLPERSPTPQKAKRSRWPIILPDDDAPEPRTERVSPKPVNEHINNSGGLSALARPFTFNPRPEPEIAEPQIDPDLSPHFTRPYPGESIKETQTVEPVVSPPSSRHSSRTDVELEKENAASTAISEKLVPSSVRYYDDLEQPTFQEIDAVMQAFNEEGSDAGIERAEPDEPSWPASSSPREHALTPGRLAEYNRILEARLRSDAPSPSPRRRLEPLAALDGQSSNDDPFSDGRAALASYGSPSHLPGSADRQYHVSDWDDVVSSGENEQFQRRASIFDRLVSGLVENAVSSRLAPVEKGLAQIQVTLANMATPEPPRRVRSRATAESDADDEDDDGQAVERNFSPRRDPKMERIRQVVLDALAVQRRSLSPVPPKHDFTELYLAIDEIKSSVLDSVSRNIQPEDIRAIVNDSIATQNEALQKREEAIKAEDDLRFAEFSQALKDAAARLNEEVEARRAAEKSAEESQRLLELAEEELALLKQAAQDDQHVGKTAQAELVTLKETLAGVEAERDELLDQSRHTAAELKEENEALKATLEEYRISSDKWRRDVQRAADEKENMQKTCNALRIQAEETIRIKESMRAKIEKLHEDMSAAAGQIANERLQWQRADVEHRTKYEVLKARAEAEARTRERLEKELDRLEHQEREYMKARAILEHTQKENTRLEDLVSALRVENAEIQKTSDQYSRDFRDAREQGRLEVQRARSQLEVELQAANNQINIVRAELESDLSRAKTAVEHYKHEIDSLKAKYEAELEQAAASKRSAIQEIAESKVVMLQEQRRSFEERLEELRKQHRRDLDHIIENKNQSESFLKETHAERLHELQVRHAREVEQVLDEKRRSEDTLNERLVLADNRIDHLQDKVLHLEEKLEVAKSAAHAAAVAATSAKAPALERSPVAARSAGPPEKINAQALRETIAVLQDQLQEREARIEQLEHDISELDTDAPAKIKAQGTEIAWLRELLAVRLDDLNDLVNALGQPDFDREAVRNAAIRIRAGLQMEQHDKERQMSGSQSFPALASISNFASPRAAQLAAAWGNWRKGRELLPSSLSQSVTSLAGSARSSTETPSKQPTTAQSFLSGLMTPPASNLRRTPSPTNLLAQASATSKDTAAVPNGSLAHSVSDDSIDLSASDPSRSMPSLARTNSTPHRRLEKQPAILQPTTPPLLRRASYDQDAAETEDGDFSTAGFYDDDESTVDDSGTPRGIVPVSPKDAITARRRASSAAFGRRINADTERFPGMQY